MNRSRRDEDRKRDTPTRRRFAKAGAAALSALSYQRVMGANERIRLGYIGVGNRGNSLLRATKEYADQHIAAVCDLRDDYIDKAVRDADTNPSRYKDYRKLIERQDIEAVVIATPDHWHALMMIHACQAGKDVYVEKPLSLTIHEGRRMVETAERTRSVVQVGIHRRSSPYCREAAELARSGDIGHITVARCARIANEWPRGIGNPPNTDPPPDVDWDLYLGPAPAVRYNENRFVFKFRWFYDYSGGQLTDNGVHFLDLIQWGLEQDAPLSVTAIGGNYALQDNREVPDTMEALWQFPGAALVIFSHFDCNGAPNSNTRRYLAEFRGTKGTLYVYNNGYEVVPEENASLPTPGGSPLESGRAKRQEHRESFTPAMEAKSVQGSADTRLHIRNFLDCIKTRAKPNCDVETAHRATTTAIVGNIAYKTRSHLVWDRRSERFTNNEQANQYLHYEYRKPWTLG